MDHMVKFYNFDLGQLSLGQWQIAFGNIRLDLLIINAYAEFYKTISFGWSVIVSVTNWPRISANEKWYLAISS